MEDWSGRRLTLVLMLTLVLVLVLTLMLVLFWWHCGVGVLCL